MEKLRLDDDLGFIFKPNLRIPKPDTGWLDQEPRALNTDKNGFHNEIESIMDFEASSKVDILSIGDSFMYGASDLLDEFFSDQNLSFYSLSMFRYCPPQYNLSYKMFGESLEPKVVLYGIFENDFHDTYDFEAWKTSGMDWFTYHNGNFFEYPQIKPDFQRYAETYFPNLNYMFRKAIKPTKKYAFSSYTPEEQSRKVFSYINKMYHKTKDHGSSFYCVLIPARDLVNGRTLFDQHYDHLIDLMTNSGIEFIDLRKPYNAYPVRAELYYKQDNHWNRSGINLAATTIYNAIKKDITF